MRVLVFGDSNTQGFWDTEGGWVARLRRYYDEAQLQDPSNKDEPTVFNLGISGDSSDKVLKRFRHEVQARNSEEIAIVIAIGVNDSRTKSGEPYATPEQYASNLQEILKQAKEFTDRILFIGLTPCEEAITNPVPWGNTGYTNDRIQLFETTLRDFCQANTVPLVKIFEQLQQERINKQLFSDGLHPNNVGHQRMYELIRPDIDRLIT